MANYVGQQIGNYRLIRSLGKGGFGEVYLAEHIFLKTRAAIKVLQDKLSASEREIFQERVRTIALLKHPNIVNILDYAVEDNVAYIVMDYIPHGSLRENYPKGTRLAPTTVLSHIKQVASALQYIHNHKLVYRDVKPANMLLDQNSNILLCDFDIATITHSINVQVKQEIIGTIQYMAPEQLNGEARRASDQYGLGIVAYEWLVGVVPFDGTKEEIIQQQLEVPPPPLRLKNPSVPIAVEQVVLKALSKHPRDRYASVSEFVNAFEAAIREGGDIPARNRKRSSIAEGQEVDFGTTLLAYGGHSDIITAIIWSPDGKRFASASYDQTVKVWDAINREQLLTYRGHPFSVFTIAWSPDGKYIASGSIDKTVQIWDTFTGNRVVIYRGHSSWVRSVGWASDGKRIVSAGQDNTAQIWNTSNARNILSYNGHFDTVTSVAWSPDGLLIASASKDTTVHVWDATTGRRVFHYGNNTREISTLAWSPDGSYIAFAGENRTVQIVDVEKRDLAATYTGHDAGITSIAWSPNGARLASASLDKTIQIWDVSSGQHVFTYKDHAAEILALAWSPDSNQIASGSRDHKVHLWQSSGQIRQQTPIRDDTFRTFGGPQAQVAAPPLRDITIHPSVWGVQPNQEPTIGGTFYSLDPVKSVSPIDENQKLLSEKAEPEGVEYNLSLFAIAQTSLEEDDIAILGKMYTLQAGMSQIKPETLAVEPFDLTISHFEKLISFDIILHESANVELLTAWRKELRYDPLNLQPQFVEFQFRVIAPEHTTFVVDYYYKQRWIRTAHIEFDAIEESELLNVQREV